MWRCPVQVSLGGECRPTLLLEEGGEKRLFRSSLILTLALVQILGEQIKSFQVFQRFALFFHHDINPN